MPNLARHVFLHPAARAIHPDWVAAADEQVNHLRAATTRWGSDDGFAALMGELRLAYEVLLLPDHGEQRLITWLPGDDATALALETAMDGSAAVSPARAPHHRVAARAVRLRHRSEGPG